MLSDVVLSCLSVCLSVCLSCPVLSVTLVYCWTDQDETWHAGRRPHCVRWGPISLPKGAQPPMFGLCLLWPNGWRDQDATWHGGRPRTRRLCVRWGPSALKNRGTAPPHVQPMSIVAKRLDGSRCHVVGSRSRLRRIVLDGDPAPRPKKGHIPQF